MAKIALPDMHHSLAGICRTGKREYDAETQSAQRKGREELRKVVRSREIVRNGMEAGASECVIEFA
jgi:hypothetical protein